MGFIDWVDTASCPQKMLGFRMNDARYFVPHLDLNLCITELGELFKNGDLIRHYDKQEISIFVGESVAGPL